MLKTEKEITKKLDSITSTQRKICYKLTEARLKLSDAITGGMIDLTDNEFETLDTLNDQLANLRTRILNRCYKNRD